MLYDITRTVHPSTSVWPGATLYNVQRILKIEEGSSVNFVTLTMNAHMGSHADAYYHYEPDGDFIGHMPLDLYVGRCRVVTVDKREGAMVPEDFSQFDLEGGERLLIHTPVSDLPDEEWPEKIPYLSVDLIQQLADLNYKLIGLDSPSVDAFDSKDLPCHHALYRHGMVNLEHLMLRYVPDGDYELIALPLKLDLACGSPVRAILRSLDE